MKTRFVKLSHWLYRFLDGKITSCFKFSIPSLRWIHRNLKQEIFFNICESIFRKSPFWTFYCINPEFGGPWGSACYGYFFLYIAIFIVLQKNALGQKKFQISSTGLKVPFWQFFNFAKAALLNPCIKFDAL